VVASGRSRIVYHFKCGEQGNTEFNVKIHEEVLVEDSLGSRTWGSAPILVSQLLQGPLTSSFAEQDVENDLRILELGSGTGLLGLAISKYIESQTERRAQIYLTDYHPDVLLNLRKNADLNDSGTEEQRVEVKVARLDWTESKSDRVTGQFDLIVAAGELSLAY
jgi:methylase of polypeptide subunit release factors